jgi:hypothetical protein
MNQADRRVNEASSRAEVILPEEVFSSMTIRLHFTPWSVYLE